MSIRVQGDPAYDQLDRKQSEMEGGIKMKILSKEDGTVKLFDRELNLGFYVMAIGFIAAVIFLIIVLVS